MCAGTAGTGISGGGTSGTVTITNSMATAIDAKGDLVAGTAADTFSRLAVGTNGQVLTAASGEATGLQWATPVSGSMTSIASGNLSGTSVTISSISQSYRALILQVLKPVITSGSVAQMTLKLNGTASGYYGSDIRSDSSTLTNWGARANIYGFLQSQTTSNNGWIQYFIPEYANTGIYKTVNNIGVAGDQTAFFSIWAATGTTAAVSSLVIADNNANTLTGGTYVLYGVN